MRYRFGLKITKESIGDEPQKGSETRIERLLKATNPWKVIFNRKTSIGDEPAELTKLCDANVLDRPNDLCIIKNWFKIPSGGFFDSTINKRSNIVNLNALIYH